MKKITDYILQGWQYFTDKINGIVVANNYMINVVCWLFCLIYGVFMIAWFEQWFVTGRADLPILLQAIEKLVMPSTLAVVKFVTESVSQTKIEQAKIQFTDKNNNGINDLDEVSNNANAISTR